jgi:hypothetical protein
MTTGRRRHPNARPLAPGSLAPGSLAPAGALLDGGLLHSPHYRDPWRDGGLLGVPDPSLVTASTAPLSFRAFIAQS